MKHIVSKSKFKPHALEYFRRIEETGEEIIITDHGRPVLRIVPYKPHLPEVLHMLRNTVKRFDKPTEPVGEEDWEAIK